jgi:Sec-independent protein translocase protein TatA
MKFFNVGALEFVFILLLAFIVLGPEKAIKAAGDVARWIRGLTKSEFWHDLISTTKEIQDLPKKLMEEADLQDTIDDLDRSLGETKRTIDRQIISDEEDIAVNNQIAPEYTDEVD